MNYIIDIGVKNGSRDQHGEHVRRDIADLGVKGVSAVSFYPLYSIEGGLSRKEIETIASRLLIDPITENYRVNRKAAPAQDRHEIEIWFKPGVTDTVAGSVVKAVQDLNITKSITVKTGQRFVLKGRISRTAAQQLAERLLVNPMIQVYSIK